MNKKQKDGKEMLGTKEDFELIRQQVNIEAVAGMLMRRQGRAYIYPGERTGSVYIYPKTNTFYDFGRAVGGDVIRLWSHIKGCNSWTALKEYRWQEKRERTTGAVY